MNNKTIGTCSICGGPVTLPSVWLGIIPPTPTCASCGAIPAEPHGPLIPMRPRRHDSWKDFRIRYDYNADS